MYKSSPCEQTNFSLLSTLFDAADAIALMILLPSPQAIPEPKLPVVSLCPAALSALDAAIIEKTHVYVPRIRALTDMPLSLIPA